MPAGTYNEYLPWEERSVIVSGLIMLVLVGSLVFAWRKITLRWKMRDVPTSKVRGLFLGVNECKGVATGATYSAPGSGKPAIWYNHKLQKEKGTGEDRYWDTIQERSEPRWIQLTDETGSTWVDMTTCEIDVPDSTFGSTATWPLESGYRHIEMIISPQMPIYVIGPVVPKADYAGLFFSKDKQFGADQSTRFVVSTKSETSLSRIKAAQAVLLLLVGFVAAALFFSFREIRKYRNGVEEFCYNDGDRTACTGFLWGTNGEQVWAFPLVLAGICVLMWLYGAWHRLAFTKERAAQTWSEIDVQLRRRSAVLPNLIATVKAYAAHEQQTLERITQARIDAAMLTHVDDNQTPDATTLSAAGQLSDQQTTAGKQLLAVAEGYPQLKASEQFLELQRTLEDTEDRIALARAYYNDTILALRDLRGVIPYTFVKGLVPCLSYNMFEAAAEARTVPNAAVAPTSETT